MAPEKKILLKENKLKAKIKFVKYQKFTPTSYKDIGIRKFNLRIYSF